MRYGDCRWTEIQPMDREKLVVVCPLAALEQHGHHLPLLTDTYLVTAGETEGSGLSRAARVLARRIANALESGF